MKNLQAMQWTRLVRYAALLLCAGSLTLALILFYRYRHDQAQRERLAFDYAKKEAFVTATKINRELAGIVTLAKVIAGELTGGTLKYELAADRLRREAEAHPGLLGISAVFVPYAYQPEVRLYAPYYVRNHQGELQRIQIEDSYDYTQAPSDAPDAPDTRWYHQGLTEGAGWTEPFFGTASDALLLLYLAPFYRVDPASLQEVIAGIVVVTLALDDVNDLTSSLDLGATGYGYVVSKQGMFISHPTKDFIGHQTIFELADSLQDEEMRADSERALRREIFARETVDQMTGRSSWIFYEPIPVTGWSIGVVLDKSELAPSTEKTMRQQIWLALELVVFLSSLSVLLFRADKGGARGLWGVAASFSVLCLLTLAFLWYLVSSTADAPGVKIVSKAGLDKFLTSHARRAGDSNLKPPVRIPTGVFIQTIKFPSPNDVTLSGYIWQKYADDIGEEISRGVVLPQVGGSPYIREAFRRQQGDVETIGWYFMVTLRQPFNPSKFPFDHANVLLRLWHQDFDQNVILTPDLDAYELINPALLPGVDDELVFSGWRASQSFFSYRMHRYSTDFGSEHFAEQTDVPELYFNVSLKRNFVDPFIAYMVPLGIVFCMIFALLVIAPRRETKDVFASLSYAAAMFFVVTVAHNGLRGKIAAQGVTYLEYFYIVMYVNILTIAIISILIATRANVRFTRYRNGFIPQLAYWPVLLGTLLAIALLTFYPRGGPQTVEEPVAVQETAKVEATATPQVEAEATATPEAVMSREAPMLKDLVQRGELPPLSMRLPANPLVVDVGGDIGRYGGIWKRAFLGPSDSGNYRRVVYDALVRFSPDGSQVQPYLVESWSHTPDFKTWTLNLRAGTRWSDGAFFSADDIVFWYQDVLLNEALVPAIPTWMSNKDGSTAQVEKVDDYAVRFSFAQPNTLFLQELATKDSTGAGGAFLPAHYLEQFHPGYADADALQALVEASDHATLQDFFEAMSAPYLNPDRPTLAPWTPETTLDDDVFILKRNPYYVGVDPQGRQLPYIDEIHFVRFDDTESLNEAALAGEFDFQSRHIDMSNYPEFLSNQEQGMYQVYTWPTFGGSDAAITFNQTYTEDLQVAELLRDKQFRIALSHAIDRGKIRDEAFLGLGEIRQPVPAPGHPYYPGQEVATQYTAYDPEQAGEILDRLGLDERDDAGFRLFATGERVILELVAVPAFGPWPEVAHLVRQDWEAVGIKTVVRELGRAEYEERAENNELQMFVWNNDTTAFPFSGSPKTDPREELWSPLYVKWYETEGAQGVEPPPEIQKLVDLREQALTVSPEEQVALAHELYRHWVDNLWQIGTVGLTPMIQGVVVFSNDLRNVPVTLGNDWPLRTPGNARPEQFFFER